jgi:hypothetical protein
MPNWGSWEVVKEDSKVVAIHACLLHTGKVLYFAGRSYPIWSRVYNPEDDSLSETIPLPIWPGEEYQVPLNGDPIVPSAIFCSGHTFLEDGSLLVAGGELPRPTTKDWYSLENQPFRGLRYTFIFDPISETWSVAGPTTARYLMAHGRWYPTLTLTNNGRVVAMTGWSDVGYFEINDVPEVYVVGSGWEALTNPSALMPIIPTALYPGATVIPYGTNAGKIFYSFPDRTSYIFDKDAVGPLEPPYWTEVASRPNENYIGVAVLLPLKPASSEMKVVTIGGEYEGDPLSATYIIDLNDTAPAWEELDPLQDARHHHNAVILPDGNVLIVGGNKSGTSENSVRTPEMFESDTLLWSTRTLPDMAVDRNYHSTALLLPNAKVWVAGGRVTDGGDVEDDVERRIEIFTPGYLLDGELPKIESCDTELEYGEEDYNISVSNAETVDSIVLIKPASTTHGNDMDQRCIFLSFSDFGGGNYRFNAPLTSNIAPPGYYMLFVLKPKAESISGTNKIPSNAVFVKISL